MRRRDFMMLLGGAAALPPVTVAAQQTSQVRRLGVIMAAGKTPEYVAALAAFVEVLGSLGWKQGDTLVIDERWSAGGRERARSAATEIVALNPTVVLGQSAAVVEALLAMTRTTPIVFVHVADPVASGFVSNLARPGGNVTGITNIEPSMGGKWLQFLKEAAPAVTRTALLVNPDTQPDRGAIFLNPFEAAARSLNVTPVKGEVHDLKDIEATMAGLATEPRGGVIVIPDAFFASHSAEIVALAQRFRLPAVYPYRYYVAQGGLLSYGVNNVDLFRQAAPYVDRILRGEKPADLPVQQPTKFDLIVNLKTAKALGLAIPSAILARADEVIE
ncbi:MAG TPA: ABC transporter substrate-binding protein [Alphaproteobacteria bacterium]|nr:ABC transporter substrate-binding protein [Alphaproteobacteria bacterium]